MRSLRNILRGLGCAVVIIIVLTLCVLFNFGGFPRGEIHYGDSVEGRTISETGDQWTFQAVKGDEITIDMEGDFDTYLILYGVDGEELIRDDDGGDGLEARISDFDIIRSGTYTIRARGYSDYTGAYTLSLDGDNEYDDEPDDDLDIPDERGTLENGVSVSGSVSDELGESWTFRGELGDQITLVTTGDLDSYIVLYDSDLRILTYNDDSGDSLNAQIRDFYLPYTGTYTVVVRGYAGLTGSYSLTITRAS